MKQSIFFSHSSKDKLLLNRLKVSLNNKTDETFDIFLSSDGQSIPFGKNWIHEIEKALENTSLMLVFLSPNSISSNWIYFESGYSYSRKIQVTPIGILGVDLNQIKPPLNLLQGFNLQNHSGLNNIIEIINIKFKSNFTLSYSKNEYDEIFSPAFSDPNITYDSVLNIIDNIEIKLPQNIVSNKQKIDALINPSEIIKNYFHDQTINFRSVSNEIEIFGLQIREALTHGDKKLRDYYISIDPLLFNQNIIHVKNLILRIYNNNLKRYYAIIHLKESFDLLNKDFKITSRLSKTGIKLSETGGKTFEFKNFLFAVDSKARPGDKIPSGQQQMQLRIIYQIEDMDNLDIISLIELLQEFGVIFER